MSTEEHKRDVYGHTVLGSEDALDGINYLDHKIDYQEAEVFFRSAKSGGSVDFEDQEGKDYTLKRNQDATYTVTRRKKKSGWFW